MSKIEATYYITKTMLRAIDMVLFFPILCQYFPL